MILIHFVVDDEDLSDSNIMYSSRKFENLNKLCEFEVFNGWVDKVFVL